MSVSNTIERAALGRPFQLGMLYDCRADVLIPGITLWDAEMLQKNINVKPQPNTDFKIIASDSTEDKADALEVSASLEASFLGGLVSVKGAAEFLNDKKKSKHQSRVTLQYRCTTRFEQLTMDHLGQGNFQHCNVFQEGSATHVVTAILYGAQAFFVFDREVSANENHQEIQGSLQATIKAIPLVSIEGKAALKMTESERQQADTFNCTFHGDFALESNPVNFQDALKVYSQLPQLLGPNGEHAVPRTVWLYPLKKLDSTAAQLVREISVGLVRQAQRILDEIDESEIRCQDLLKDDIAINFSEITDNLRKFKSLISEYRQVFQKNLCKLLPVIRGGGTTEQDLITALSSKQRSPFQSVLMTEYLSDREREMNVIRSYLEIMKEVKVVTSSAGLDQVVLNSKNDFVVAFVFSSLSGGSGYLQDLEDYLKGEFTGSDTIYEDKSAATDEQWFRSGKVTSFTRQTIRLFLDFMQSNGDRENIEFCIASVPNKSITAASIHVYEKGTLLDSQFLLPSSPPSPKVLRLEHDCVHLQIDPPVTGEEYLLSYRILYQTSKEAEWKEIGTDGKVTSVTVSRLHPHTEYRFSCKAVCRPGVSLPSDPTEFLTTRPCSPPGIPNEKVSESERITVTWDIPTMVGDDVTVISYDIEYRQYEEDDSKSKPWECAKSTSRECTLYELKVNTTYSIRVFANTGTSGKSLPSPEAHMSTLGPDTKSQKKTSQSKSERFLQQSIRLEKGNPSVHVLSLDQKYREDADFFQYMFGRKVEDQKNKVILMLGSTGAGKTTLVNVMINYILGVKWEDRYRFKLINEMTNRTQAESQTSEVTSYELYNQPGFQIPYSLTIIDTPGFGDTRGLAQDKLITEQVKSFLCSPLGVDHIDAVCFVVQASLARLSASQRYIFDSILSIFGKDIGENIMVLLTFVDSDKIPALEAIKAAELPCKKNKKGQPTHFKFNNSTLYVQKKDMDTCGDEDSSDEDDDDDDDEEEEKMKSIVWSTTFKQMKMFFKCLGETEGKDLTLTKKVLEERERLENATARLTPQITAGLAKLSEINSFKHCLENEDAIMNQNKNFEQEVEELKAIRSNVNFFATNCNRCLFTCHSGCFLPESDNVRTCAVMNEEGNCLVCPKNCSYTEHQREKALWTYETTITKKTIQELKDNFMKAQGQFMSNKQMLETLEEEFHVIEDKLMYLIKLSSTCIKRLNEIALKATSMSTFDYIEILIRTEEDEKKPGFEDRVIGLKKMKQEAEILDKIARGENVMPQERRMVKHKIDRIKKSAQQVKQMNAVLKAWPKQDKKE